MVPRLHHAPTSYYSMIARLGLVEAGVRFESRRMDIHRRRQQLDPAYARLNPGLTVPTLELEDRVLADSRDILDFAFGGRGTTEDPETRAWVDRHYTFSIEELTFGKLLGRYGLLGRVFPRQLAATERQILALADAHPDLAAVYRRRAAVFAHRSEAFDPKAIVRLYEARLATAREHLDALEAGLADGRSTLVAGGYGPADVVWTVFVARLRFIRLDAEIDERPALARYARAMFARPSFTAADVWARLDVWRMLKDALF